MKLEAVTVCVNYADFLEETAKVNRQHIDHWVIVTDRKDEKTLDVCHRHNLEALVTDEFYAHGDKFNKGRGVERGLALLGHHDWVVHIDADIALPRDFTESLHDAHLDPECIYGVDRLMLKSWEEWQDFKGRHSRGYHCYVPNGKKEVGARWADVRYGYVPIGFFQLWHRDADHRKGVRLRRYPDRHQNAARADVQFALQWDRRHRQLIPEVFVAHLESQDAAMGANWVGRTTRPFGPAGEAMTASRPEMGAHRPHQHTIERHEFPRHHHHHHTYCV
jgi:hypothetical protein